jgi:acetoin utilization deacetylase AcuC-like enzyme
LPLLDTVQPDFIFYLSGVDILSTDKFGKFNVSIDECKQRDELVLKIAYDNKIPITIAMGGGYSPDINDILQAHCNTFRTAAYIF